MNIKIKICDASFNHGVELRANIGKTVSTYEVDSDKMLVPLAVLTFYERLNVCINCDRTRDRKLPLDHEFIKANNIGDCTCDPIPELFIKNIIISIVDSTTLPIDSIYHIDAICGVQKIKPEHILMRGDVTGMYNINFSIYESMDEYDLINKGKVTQLFTYDRKYYRKTNLPDKCGINYFREFKGVKLSSTYMLYFLTLVEKYMRPVIVNTEKKRKSTREKIMILLLL